MYSDKNTACVDTNAAYFTAKKHPWLSRLSRTLSFKQATIALVVALTLGLVFGLLQIRSDLANERLRMDETFNQILRVAKPSAVQASYALDHKLAANVVEGLFEYKAVCRAAIVDHREQVMAVQRRPEKQNGLRQIATYFFGPAREYQLELRFGESDLVTGRLDIKIDTLVIAESFFERSGFTLISGLLRTLLLAAILGVLFHFMLTRPLKQVAQAIKTRQSTVTVPAAHKSNELGDLVEAYNNQFHQRAKAQARLRRLNQELEGRVAERTRQLEQAKSDLEGHVLARTRQLNSATQAAKTANQAKSDFLAHMSHELRTPLNAIVGFSQVLVDELFGEISNLKYKEYAADINNASIHLLSLITDILNVSKVEAGEMELEEKQIEVRELIETCKNLVRDPVAKKRIMLSAAIASDVGDVRADPRLLKQVVFNLLDNAVKYSDDDGSISLNAALTEEKALQICVADSGCGIASRDIKRALEPFSQIHDRPDLTHGGTGLGLPIAKQFTELHGGTLTIESIPGVKIVATVTLPATRTII
ncbi:MAG: hypothetical protein HQ483_05090 [Rhodospirillales bacterium]|nr:hypothetical protein [Rhodospirillales bacterium]